VADPALALLALAGDRSAPDPVPATFGDPAQFLHVHVDELARTRALIAADLPTALAVDVVEPVEVVADQDTMHGRSGDPQPAAQAIGTELVRTPDPTDPGLELLGGAPRRTARTTGAVEETLTAGVDVAMPPLGRTAPRDAHGRGYMGDRCAGFDPLAQEESTLRRERGVTVRHEDLREVVLAWTPAHLHPEVFALVDLSRVTNVYVGNT
jgi:hypothetical protein